MTAFQRMKINQTMLKLKTAHRMLMEVRDSFNNEKTMCHACDKPSWVNYHQKLSFDSMNKCMRILGKTMGSIEAEPEDRDLQAT